MPNPDHLATNGSAVQIMSDETLKLVKRTLRRYGYPPDKQEQATHTILAQAELLSDTWVA